MSSNGLKHWVGQRLRLRGVLLGSTPIRLRNVREWAKNFFRGRPTGNHIERVWVYRGKCAVVDFKLRHVRFAFDIELSGPARVSVFLVQRDGAELFEVIDPTKTRERVAENVSVFAALKQIDAKAAEIIAGAKAAAKKRRKQGAKSRPTTPGLRKKPMTVGLMTLPFNANIGGVLQSYALAEALKQLGHNPVSINVRHPKLTDDGKPITELSAPDAPLYQRSFGLDTGAATAAFLDRNFASITRPFTTSGQFAAEICDYGLDAIVVGSDQVWRPRYAKTHLSNYYLGFLPKEDHSIKRISYAASFAADRWEYGDDQTKRIARLLQRFDAVSVREDNGAAFCRDKFGVTPQHVVDPTMLLPRSFYDGVVPPGTTAHHPRGLMTYILDPDDEKRALVEFFAEELSVDAWKSTGLPFFGAAPDGQKPDHTIEGWLAAYQNAEFVVTDSFHGCVFAILFNRPFVAYGNEERGLARFTSLLGMFDLEDRLVTNLDEANYDTLKRPIDWDHVNARLKTLRAEAFEFLEGALAVQPVSAKTAAETPAKAPLPGETDNPLNALCTGCGACVSESQGALQMVWNADGFWAPELRGDSIPEDAIRVCPFNPTPEDAVKDEDALAELFLPTATTANDSIGKYVTSYVGQSHQFRPTSSSGGIGTYMFEQLLAQGHVDYIYVVQGDGERGYQYRVLSDAADIQKASKTRYYPVTLDKLFSIIERSEGRVAVSGVSCFIKAIRLKQHYHPELKEKIPFVVGIICGGLKSRHYTEFLAQSAGISGGFFDPEYRKKNPKGTADDYSFSALDQGTTAHSVRMKRLGDMWGTGLFKSVACEFCTDVTAELADISLGDAWLPDYKTDGMGHSVIVTRSALADDIIKAGIENGDLAAELLPEDQVIRSQLAGLNHRQKAVWFRTWLAKTQYHLPVPPIRARFQKNVALAEAMVQILRLRTRSKSLAAWRETPDAKAFVRKMRAPLKLLRSVTTARNERKLSPELVAAVADGTDTAEAQAQDSSADIKVFLRWLKRMERSGRTSKQMLKAGAVNSVDTLLERDS